MECVEKIIRKEMIDPVNGKPLKEDDIIELQRGGTASYCSQCVVTMECVEKIIRKEMIDPVNGKPLKEDDIIELQRGGTGN
ncbi:unnamed protein product [Gongylonema pulchrum]|uniref:(2Fe-2S)-binding protein n=1 Tax=Gongylonema pulchrum TaxID=637853 RepID=A0A183DNV5_9BILA|nr:unnamed protein product [Gongylonema pulchrum]